MEIKKVTQVHFSPSGTTRKTAEALSESFGLPVDDADLLHDPSVTRRFGADKLVIFCLPVFAGRLPEFCPKLLSQFTGSDTPALAVVVYGNRDYEDALLELADLLKSRGFVLAGAAAVVAQHSIFPAVAAGRPDAADIEKLHSFAASAAEKIRLAAGPEDLGEFPIPGNHPYRKLTNVPMHPRATSACIQCGTCASVCPTGAIPLENGGSPTGACASPAPPASRPARWMPVDSADQSLPSAANSSPTSAPSPVSRNFSCNNSAFF